MVRKSSEAEDDSAAKAVRTKAPPRDEDADDEGSSPTTKNTPANESKTEQEDKKLKAAAKGRLTQAPGSFQEEMNGGSKVASAKAKGGADPVGRCQEIIRACMSGQSINHIISLSHTTSLIV